MQSNQRLVLKVLPSDKTALRRLAEAEGEAMAVIVRRLIRKEAKARGFWPSADQQTQSQELADGR